LREREFVAAMRPYWEGGKVIEHSWQSDEVCYIRTG